MQIDQKQAEKFTIILMDWDLKQNFRQMPWKGQKDPYKIWLSEVILQQTRVEQGWAYYNRFIERYPDIHSLAASSEEQVYKLWEGLGYYSRCKNLIETARYISKERNGQFPDTYEEIVKLKGIGPYTAAAISSFAFHLPHAVVDGNVYRVLARIFGIYKAVDDLAGKKIFAVLAGALLDKKNPAAYNQAIMDFGAVICKPVSPLCYKCPFRTTCIAFINNAIDKLPVKKRKVAMRKRWFYYFIFENNNEVAVMQRLQKDIWQNLFEFFLIEAGTEQDVTMLVGKVRKQKALLKKDYEVLSISEIYRQQLSHQLIYCRFIKIKIMEKSKIGGQLIWKHKQQTNVFAFPRIINQYLGNSL